MVRDEDLLVRCSKCHIYAYSCTPIHSANHCAGTERQGHESPTVQPRPLGARRAARNEV